MGNPPAQAYDRPLSQHWIWAIAIAAIAFLIRLVPVLRGGGLLGIGNYDDGVYYAAATGLIHGLLPYQDFLLLHPPGSTLLLAPFAAVAQLTGGVPYRRLAALGVEVVGDPSIDDSATTFIGEMGSEVFFAELVAMGMEPGSARS